MIKLFALFAFPILFGFAKNHQPTTPCYKADVIFLIDYSGSMSAEIPYYEPWLRSTALELPLSDKLKAGLLFFSNDVCSIQCDLTDDKFFFDNKITESRICPSSGTYLLSSFERANVLFDNSEKKRGEHVPRIIIIVTDSDVSDDVEACDFIQSEMSDVFFIVIDLKYKEKIERIQMLLDCMTNNGILFDGFVWIYEDLLKNFDPCM